MDPKPLTQAEFEAKYVRHAQYPNPFHEEREWWGLNGHLGVVILDKVDQDWSHVVLSRDGTGRYVCLDQGTSARSIIEAREQLFEKLRALPAARPEGTAMAKFVSSVVHVPTVGHFFIIHNANESAIAVLKRVQAGEDATCGGPYPSKEKAMAAGSEVLTRGAAIAAEQGLKVTRMGSA